jgi:hypothetical protein
MVKTGLKSQPETAKTGGDGMSDAVEHEKSGRPKRSSWWWPAGALAAGAAGAAAVVAFRGCWHRKMSWPIGVQGHSYQVCLSCGAKRLFDENTFSAYGPFRRDLNELRAWEASRKRESSLTSLPPRSAS